MAQSCKSCKFLVVPLNAAGRRQTRYDRGYDCRALAIDDVSPDSIVRKGRSSWRNVMQPGDGVTCPTWQKYEVP